MNRLRELLARGPVSPWSWRERSGLLLGLEAVQLVITAMLIARRFAYLGYHYRSVGLLDVVGGVVALVLVALSLPDRITRPSGSALWFLACTVAVPVVGIPILFGPLSTPTLLMWQLAVAAAFGLMRWLVSGPVWHWPTPRVSERTYFVALAVIVVGSLVAVYASTGAGLSWTAFTNIYARRFQYASHVSLLGGYTVGALSGAVAPVLLALGMHRRSWRIVAASVATVAGLYLLTAQKSYLIGPALAVVGYFVVTYRTKRWVNWSVGFAAAIIGAGLFDTVTRTAVASSLVIRRGMTTAGINSSYYVDYFSSHPTAQLRSSILSRFGGNPYPLPLSRLIAQHYYGPRVSAANANFLADGFANFGVIGVLGAGLVIGLYLKAYDAASVGLDVAVSAAAITMVLVAWTNTASLTGLATHGALALLALVALTPRSTAPTPGVDTARPLRASHRLSRHGGSGEQGRHRERP